MNCLLIFSMILLDWMTIIVSAVECPSTQNPINVMGQLRVNPPSTDELLNEVYAYIEECPHSPVSDIKTVLLSHWTAYFGDQGSPSDGQRLPSDVHDYCTRVLKKAMKDITINYILACRFIQNYVMVQLQPSGQTKTNVEIIVKIQGVYGQLQQGTRTTLAHIVYDHVRVPLGKTAVSINSVVKYCDLVILPRPANLPMFAVVTCDFIKKYQKSIKGKQRGWSSGQ